MSNPFQKQLESVISRYKDAMQACQYNDGSDMSDTQLNDILTQCLAAIERASGRDSIYCRQARESRSRGGVNVYGYLASVVGVARSLLTDIRDGNLKSLEEIIHADVFADFLEMADHLVTNGFKDAAAVIAGSTLEAHLRNLCAKHTVSVDHDGKPRKADSLNADLVKAGAYSKIDLKNVIAWLGLRNDAAHGNYGAYDDKQVLLLISSVRDFVTRNPA